MKRSTGILLGVRIVQLLTGIVIAACGIVMSISNGSYWFYVNCAWSGAIITMVAVLSIAFLTSRPFDLWPLTLTLDVIGLGGCIVGIVEFVDSSYSYEYYPVVIVYVALGCAVIDTLLFIATGIWNYRLHYIRFKQSDPSNPFTPYLMKREVDVWCYPVQNENGQPGVQYVQASTDNQGHILPLQESQRQQVETSEGPQQPLQGEYQIQSIEIVQSGQQSMSSQPLTDTVAGWSVPSRNATLRLSQVGPGLFTPSFRSPEPTIKSIDEESR